MRPALLHGFRRHRVRGRDYPGIVPVSNSNNATGNSSDKITMTTPNASSVPPASVQEGASVLGSLVSGLTDGDVRRLDQFEGSQYEKCQVRVCMLRSIASSSQEERLKDTLNAQTHVAEEGEEIEATAYVWISGREWLEDAEWDFETFKRDKMKWWVAADERDW